jgi:hypothetical protein
MKPLLAIAALALLAPLAHADSSQSDYIIQVTGGFSAQGETFSVSYQADLSGYQQPYGLVAGTFDYSASGPLGTITAASAEASDAGWIFSNGDEIILQMFRTPGCGIDPGNECQPEVGPAEGFAPGFTDAHLNAFANGFFEVLQPGQTFSPGMFGDVQVSFVPEPSSLYLLAVALAALTLKRKQA